MSAQGSNIFDTQYIDSLIKEIDDIDLCRDLQALESEVFKEIQDQLDALEGQMAVLKPIVELLENPAAELPKIIEWIGKFIEGVLKPMYQPYVTMASQITAYAEAVARLTAAIEAAAQRIGTCAVTGSNITFPSP